MARIFRMPIGKINSEFFIFNGRGHLSRDDEWSAYQERTRVSVGMAVAHGFITDPEIWPDGFSVHTK